MGKVLKGLQDRESSECRRSKESVETAVRKLREKSCAFLPHSFDQSNF